MPSVGPGHYYVVGFLHVGGSKASDIKHVLQREPRTCKTWFLAGSILPNEEHVDAVIRKLLEETDLTLTSDDLTLCDEYSPATVHCNTMHKYSLLIPIRAFPSEGRQRGYVATAI
jgi:hypothetical protein